MNPDRTIQATMWLMIVAQTIGSVDLPGQGPRKLPAPRQYVAIFVLWSILGLGADAGGDVGRVSAAFSWLLVLAGMVLGPFGKRFNGFLRGVATLFPVGSQSQPTVTHPNSVPVTEA